MTGVQLEFWPPTTDDARGTARDCDFVSDDSSPERHEYTSLKRVNVVQEISLQIRPQLRNACDATRFFREYWSERPATDQERFVVACLNVKNRIQSVFDVTVGTVDASLVHPREVFKPAIIEGASSVILSHNHPSGDPTPSREDMEVTRRLEQAGELIGIEVMDHIVYGDVTGEAVSIRQRRS